MLSRLSHLRWCRFVAVLAAVLLLGAAGHIHAAPDAVTSVASASLGGDGDAQPADCGLCHVARGTVLPHVVAVAPPGNARVTVVAAVREGPPGRGAELPSRPPRTVPVA